MNEKEEKSFITWHHSPSHLFIPNTTYIVTAGTSNKKNLFHDTARMYLLQNILFKTIEKYNWKIEAWALFSNHYHFIATSPSTDFSLQKLIQYFHGESGAKLNELDQTPGRQVWFQYWDTCLTYDKSYFARLNYVQNNPVKHKLVTNAEQYPFCSASWFATKASPTLQRKVKSFGYENIKIVDEF